MMCDMGNASTKSHQSLKREIGQVIEFGHISLTDEEARLI